MKFAWCIPIILSALAALCGAAVSTFKASSAYELVEKLETRTTRQEERVDAIREDLAEMKRDIKELLRR